MQQTIDDKANHEDLLFQQEQKHADMVKQSQSLAQKSMKKFIASWKNYSLYTAFTTWKLARDGHSKAKS